MIGTSVQTRRSLLVFDAALLKELLLAAGPALLFGLRLWISVCFALYVAFWLQLDSPFWAGTSAAIVCQPRLGASLRKGWYRMIGTLVGAVGIVLLTACFPQDRALFLVGLALWGAACTLVATLLRNFGTYAAALAGYTAAIIASDQLGATGGPDGQAFMLAITRASEICIGIVCAGMILAGTDFGGARRRLAETIAALSAETANRFTGTLAQAGSDLTQTQPIRRELVRRAIALDPTIDEALGESSDLRYHSPVLQAAVDGLFAALAGWRTVAVHLTQLHNRAARQQADVVLQQVPPELRSSLDQGEPARWMANPIRLHRLCEAAARALNTLPARTPSQRLLADQSVKVLAGLSQALDGLALLVADPAQAHSRRRGVRLHVPDWLPALVNAGRAFVTIGAVEVFWIATAWPNGASALTFAAVSVFLFAPRADQAYPAAKSFMVGVGFAAALAAILEFTLLPMVTTFAGFGMVMGLCLVPAGALMAQPWRTAMFAGMAGNIVPILAPTNQMSYDTVQFYNAALAIVVGCGVAAVSFRVLPPLSPALRTRRLLTLSLRDLHRVATGPVPQTPEDWEDRIYSRLAVLPDEAEPLQRAQLLAALSVGVEIIRLRQMYAALAIAPELDSALAALAQGKGAVTRAQLARLDHRLALLPDTNPDTHLALRARASILAISETLAEHDAYFDARGTA
jgi:uncharacterized membrane protein YccC